MENIYEKPGQVDDSPDYATPEMFQMSKLRQATPQRSAQKLGCVTKAIIAGCVLNFVLILLLAATLFYLQTRAATKSEVNMMISQVEEMAISLGPAGPPGPAGNQGYKVFVLAVYVRRYVRIQWNSPNHHP